MSTKYASGHRVAVSSVLDGIGDTPLVPVEGIYCKLEYLNPSGSIKARIAKYMVERAERGPPKTRRHDSRGFERQHRQRPLDGGRVKGYRMLVVMPGDVQRTRRHAPSAPRS